jgi:hypothetical protein
MLDRRLVRPYPEVLFAVPWSWQQEWDDKLKVALFYDDSEGSGTLQVQFAWVAGLPPHAQAQVDKQIMGPQESESAEGEGRRDVSWQVIGVVGRSMFTLFLNFIVSEAQLARPEVQREIRLLDESIRAVKVRPPR